MTEPPLDTITRVFVTPTFALAEQHGVVRDQGEGLMAFQKRVLMAALTAAFRGRG